MIQREAVAAGRSRLAGATAGVSAAPGVRGTEDVGPRPGRYEPRPRKRRAKPSEFLGEARAASGAGPRERASPAPEGGPTDAVARRGPRGPEPGWVERGPGSAPGGLAPWTRPATDGIGEKPS